MKTSTHDVLQTAARENVNTEAGDCYGGGQL